MIYGTHRDVPAHFRRLTGLVDLLAGLDDVRDELIRDIRAQIDRGEYLTEDKLNIAIHRLLREIMTEQEERVS